MAKDKPERMITPESVARQAERLRKKEFDAIRERHGLAPLKKYPHDYEETDETAKASADEKGCSVDKPEQALLDHRKAEQEKKEKLAKDRKEKEGEKKNNKSKDV